MTDYRCYCLDAAGHIHNVTTIATDCDERARTHGAELLDQCHHAAVEIWAGARRIAQITRFERAAARNAATAGSCCGNGAS